MPASGVSTPEGDSGSEGGSSFTAGSGWTDNGGRGRAASVVAGPSGLPNELQARAWAVRVSDLPHSLGGLRSPLGRRACARRPRLLRVLQTLKP
jgi:hypothetical protein